MDKDPTPDNNSELSNSVPLQANLVNSDDIGTVAPGRLSGNPINSQQTNHGGGVPQKTTGLTKVNGIKHPKHARSYNDPSNNRNGYSHNTRRGGSHLQNNKWDTGRTGSWSNPQNNNNSN